MQARKRTNSTTDAAPAPKAAAANPPTIPTPVPAAAVEATKTADDSLPVNAPPSMRAAVSKWRLSAPYEVATESAWKAYVGFRTKCDQENPEDEQDDECWCDGELASWGVQNRMRGVLKAVLTGSAIAKDPKLQPLLPRLVSGVYVTKATSEDDGNDDLRSIDIEALWFSPFGAPSALVVAYSYHHRPRAYTMEHFIEGSISERTFGGEAERRIKFFTESAGKSTVTRKIDSNDALQKLQFVMFADELLSQPKWMEVLCAVSGLALVEGDPSDWWPVPYAQKHEPFNAAEKPYKSNYKAIMTSNRPSERM